MLLYRQWIETNYLKITMDNRKIPVLNVFNIFTNKKNPQQKKPTPKSLIDQLGHSSIWCGKNGLPLYEHFGDYLIIQLISQMQMHLDSSSQEIKNPDIHDLPDKLSLECLPWLPTQTTSAKQMMGLYGTTKFELPIDTLKKQLQNSRLYVHHQGVPAQFIQHLYHTYILKKTNILYSPSLAIKDILSDEYDYYHQKGWGNYGFNSQHHFEQLATLSLSDLAHQLCQRHSIIFLTSPTTERQHPPRYRLRKTDFSKDAAVSFLGVTPIHIPTLNTRQRLSDSSLAFDASLMLQVKKLLLQKWQTILYANLSYDFLIIPDVEDMIQFPEHCSSSEKDSIKYHYYHILHELLLDPLYYKQYQAIFCESKNSDQLQYFFSQHHLNPNLVPINVDPYLFAELMSQNHYALSFVNVLPIDRLLGFSHLAPLYCQPHTSRLAHLANISTLIFGSLKYCHRLYTQQVETAWTSIPQVKQLAMEQICLSLLDTDYLNDVVTPLVQQMIFPLSFEIERLEKEQKKDTQTPIKRLTLAKEIHDLLSELIKLFEVIEGLFPPKKRIDVDDLESVGLSRDFYNTCFTRQVAGIYHHFNHKMTTFLETLTQAKQNHLLDEDTFQQFSTVLPHVNSSLKNIVYYMESEDQAEREQNRAQSQHFGYGPSKKWQCTSQRGPKI